MRFGGKQLIHVLDLLFQVHNSLFSFGQGSLVCFCCHGIWGCRVNYYGSNNSSLHAILKSLEAWGLYTRVNYDTAGTCQRRRVRLLSMQHQEIIREDDANRGPGEGMRW